VGAQRWTACDATMFRDHTHMLFCELTTLVSREEGLPLYPDPSQPDCSQTERGVPRGNASLGSDKTRKELHQLSLLDPHYQRIRCAPHLSFAAQLMRVS